MGNVFALPTQGPIQSAGAVTGPGKSTLVPSSFGINATTFGEFSAKSFVSSERYRELEFRERFYRCTQHDGKMFDFSGRMIRPGPPTSQPMLAMHQSPHYVPLEMRRPNAPYRLARMIVNAFTGLLFGHDRWPTIQDNDPATQDFAQALAVEANLPTVMIRARNIGGSVGTVGLSWRFVDGVPRVTTHNGKHLFVHEWFDRDECIPSHVSEVYQFPRDVFDREKKQVVRKWFWFRRDWTLIADVQFEEVEAGDSEPDWRIDTARSFIHNDGFCHFVWVQNLPEDDATNVDGSCDYSDLYESCNSIDVLNSVIMRGACLNLDPTLKLKMDPQLVSRFGVRKGSDNALAVGKDGDASYMELSGASMSVGINLFEAQRNAALETAQCVLPDPNTITAAGTSSVALRIVYAPMLSKASIMRTQYGRAIERLLTQMVDSARSRYGTAAGEQEVDFEPVDDTGTLREVARPVHYTLTLPPRIEREPVVDPLTGLPTGEIRVREVEREPGSGRNIKVAWPEFFKPTTNDMQVTTQTMLVAVGGKPVLSQRAAVDIIARAYSLDSDAVFGEIVSEAQAAKAAEAEMFPSTGGEVTPPPEEELNPVEAEQTQKVALTASDLASIVSVNEGRASVGYGPLLKPDGTLDPDGDLTIAEFQAKREAKGAKLGEAIGEAESPPPPPPPPPPPEPAAPPGAPAAPGTAAPAALAPTPEPPGGTPPATPPLPTG